MLFISLLGTNWWMMKSEAGCLISFSCHQDADHQQQQFVPVWWLSLSLSLSPSRLPILCSLSSVVLPALLPRHIPRQPNLSPLRQNPCCAITSLPTRKHPSTHRHLIMSSLLHSNCSTSSLGCSIETLSWDYQALQHSYTSPQHSHTIDWVKFWERMRDDHLWWSKRWSHGRRESCRRLRRRKGSRLIYYIVGTGERGRVVFIQNENGNMPHLSLLLTQ